MTTQLSVDEGLDLLRTLLPQPWSITGLIANVSDYYRREVRVIRVPMPVEGSVSGMFWPQENFDLIAVADGISVDEFEQTTCHEIAHLVLNHRPAFGPNLATLARLLPLLDSVTSPALARRMLLTPESAPLFRHGYSAPMEADAESLASRIRILADKVPSVKGLGNVVRGFW